MDCVLLIIPQQPPTPTLTCDEPNVLLGCLHLPDHVVLQVAEVAVQPVGHPVVVVLVHGLRHQVLGELLEAGPGQVPRRFGRLKYSARVQGVHVGVLLGELELVPVRGHEPLERVPDEKEDEGVCLGARNIRGSGVEVLRRLVQPASGNLEVERPFFID